MAAKKQPARAVSAIDGKTGDQLVAINRLHLDLHNPRHEPVENQAEAIANLCNEEFVEALAADIADRGALSPLEVMGVIPLEGHPGHFVALEGNRRACALIVLQDPERAPKAMRAKLRRLAEKANLPTRIKVHIFSDREEAMQWVELRHLGEQDGVGTRRWSPTQKNRAAGGSTSKTTARDNALAVLVLDRLVECGMLTEAQRRAVPVSTLTRYVGTPTVRAILGLGSSKELIYTHAADEVDRALHQLVLDIITPQADGGFKANSRSDTRGRQTYANELKASGFAPTTHIDEPQAPPAPSKSRAQRERADDPKKRSARDPDKRRHLIPNDFVLTSRDPVLARLRIEALKLEVDDFSFSASYLLRAMIEQVSTLFLKQRGKWRQKMQDHALAKTVAEELEAAGVTGKAVSVPRKSGSDMDCAYSLHSLGHAIHGGSVPTGTEIKRHFDTWRPALEAMLAQLEAPKAPAK